MNSVQGFRESGEIQKEQGGKPTSNTRDLTPSGSALETLGGPLSVNTFCRCTYKQSTTHISAKSKNTADFSGVKRT